jgi:plastocyanin
MNKTIIAIVVVAVVLLGLIWYFGVPGAAPQGTPETQAPADSVAPRSPDGLGISAVKEFTLTASNFKYDVTEIHVKKGDTVRLTLKIAEGHHDWNVDEFHAKTNVLQAGQEQTIEFVADQAGTFEYYCSVGNHRAMGMVGKLVVEE